MATRKTTSPKKDESHDQPQPNGDEQATKADSIGEGPAQSELSPPSASHGVANPGRGQAFHNALGTLLPWIIVVMIAFAVAGQVISAVLQNSTIAIVCYAIAVLAFLIALRAERYYQVRPSKRSLPWISPWINHRVWRWLLTIVVFSAALFLVNARYAIPSILVWLSSLGLALFAALPQESSLTTNLTTTGLRLFHWAKTREGIAAVICLFVGMGICLYNLNGVPSGIHGDEAELALLSLAVLQGKGAPPFGMAFLGDPALFLYFQAAFLALLGPTVEGMRALGAICGALTLPMFFLLLRKIFGPRVALLGLILLAGSAVELQFAHLALSLAEVPLLTCLAMLAVWKGYETKKAFWWLLSGIAGAFAIYFNFSGRLFPVILALFLIYLLITARGGWRDYLRGGAMAFLGGILTLAPMGVQIAHDPSVFTSHMTSRLIFNNWDRMAAAYHTNDAWVVLGNQFKVNILSFINGMNGASFYPYPGQAMLATLLAPLFILGMVLIIVRFKDARVAFFTITFWVVMIVHGIITIDSPQPHRLALALLPAIAGIALALDWIALTISRLTRPQLAPVCFGAAVLITLAGGVQDLGYYLGPGVASKPWETVTTQARYAAALGPTYRVYTVGTPYIYFAHGITRYLAHDVEGGSLHNPIMTLPMAVAADHDLAFLVYSPLKQYQPLIEAIYPNSRIETINGINSPIFNAVLIPRSEIAAWQGLTAHYGNTERMERDPGNLGGGATAYPAEVTWTGSVFAPQNGRYRLLAQNKSGGPIPLKIDGASIEANRDYDLSIGWHALEIKGPLADAQARVELRWQSPNQQMGPLPLYDLDARALKGNLLCTIKSEGRGPIQRLDRTIGFRAMSDIIGTDKPSTLDWEGKLKIATAGAYTFAINANGPTTLTIDGQTVVSNQSTDASIRTSTGSISLSQGSHSFAVHHQLLRAPGSVEVLWTPPNQNQSVIPPEAFEKVAFEKLR